MEIIAGIRQFFYPREFRIGVIERAAELESNLKDLVEALQHLPPPSSSEEGDQDSFLADIATGLWRLRGKMVDMSNEVPTDDVKWTKRYFESVWDALTSADIRVVDHTNTPFDSGLSLKSLAFQPTPGLTREMVIETIKPTVYKGQRKIQMGEVIVGTPA